MTQITELQASMNWWTSLSASERGFNVALHSGNMPKTNLPDKVLHIFRSEVIEKWAKDKYTEEFWSIVGDWDVLFDRYRHEVIESPTASEDNSAWEETCKSCGGNGYKSGIVSLPGTDCNNCKGNGKQPASPSLDKTCECGSERVTEMNNDGHTWCPDCSKVSLDKEPDGIDPKHPVANCLKCTVFKSGFKFCSGRCGDAASDNGKETPKEEKSRRTSVKEKEFSFEDIAGLIVAIGEIKNGVGFAKSRYKKPLSRREMMETAEKAFAEFERLAKTHNQQNQ